MNPFLHSKMQFKQHKIVILNKFISHKIISQHLNKIFSHYIIINFYISLLFVNKILTIYHWLTWSCMWLLTIDHHSHNNKLLQLFSYIRYDNFYNFSVIFRQILSLILSVKRYDNTDLNIEGDNHQHVFRHFYFHQDTTPLNTTYCKHLMFFNFF